MLSLSDLHSIHFTGIKGVGMTSLACIAYDYGMTITGSDTEEHFVTDSILLAKGINDISPFSANNIEKLKPDFLVYTVAHSGEDNEEVKKARSLNIPTLSFAQALGIFTQDKTAIAVSGVGGKTTTTAMITTALTNLNANPNYMIGSGQVKPLPFPGAYHKDSPYFIVEADEYKSSIYDTKPKFYYLNPKIIIIPNLAFDHPDVYRDENHTLDTFKTYIEKLPADGALIINLDCPMCQKLLAISKPQAKVISYSINQSDAQFKITNINSTNGISTFTLDNYEFNLPLIGDIYIANASATILALHFLGFDYDQINQALQAFDGVKRRFEKIFDNGSTLIYDDYAHHPDEICCVLNLVKNNFADKKIIAIFEPHTLSRTQTLLDDFASCFTSCQQVLIPDIFTSARETDDHSISSNALVDKINEIKLNAHYLPTYENIIDYLKTQDLASTIILTLGAGNIYQVAHKIKDYLEI